MTIIRQAIPAVDPPRRRFLFQAAGAVAGGAILGAALPLPQPSEAAQAAPVDPVYGLIEAHRAAWAAHQAACEEQNRLEVLLGTCQAHTSDDACDAENDAFDDLCAFPATTLAGLRAWALYISDLHLVDGSIYATDGRIDGGVLAQSVFFALANVGERS